MDIHEYLTLYNKLKSKSKSKWVVNERDNEVIKFIIIDTPNTLLEKSILNELKINRYLMKNKKKLVNTLVPLKVGEMSNKKNYTKRGWFIKMEKMDGSINKLNKNVKWYTIFLQIMIGIKSLNNIGVFHNDLSPRNILFKKMQRPKTTTIKLGRRKFYLKRMEYEIKIADFGISRIVPKKLRSQSLKNNVAYLTSSLVYDIDYRVENKRQFNLNNTFRKRYIGLNKKQLLKKSKKNKRFSLESPTFNFTKKDVYLFLKNNVKPNKILNIL